MSCIFLDMTQLLHYRGFTCQVESLSNMKTSSDGLVYFYNANVSMMGYPTQVEWNEFCRSDSANKAETCKKYYGGQFPCRGNVFQMMRNHEKVKNQDISLMSNPEFESFGGRNLLIYFCITIGATLAVAKCVTIFIVMFKSYKGREKDVFLFCGHFEKSVQGESVFSKWNGLKDAKSIFGNVNQRNIAASQLISDEELQYHEFYQEGGISWRMKIFYILIAIIPLILFTVISFLTIASILSVGAAWLCLVIFIAFYKHTFNKFSVNVLLTNMKIMIMKANGWKVELISIELSSISRAWNDFEDEHHNESHFLTASHSKLCIELKHETNPPSTLVLLEKTNNPQVYIEAINKYTLPPIIENQINPTFNYQESSQNISTPSSSMYPSFTDYEMKPYQN
ncbi:predicted protein [Naegleria gruberi]|uniref:Predicted protein n=1 Tax=Naegleria gruberi TaxID=5762 RepID=D2V6X8_NAEGR|nr:uncharacterized protein NAEGRDRAFT_57327 [Naegleria gruberi]EFC47648.1 predicted protein [Naegleria gruberi]|eukprot:XP_002680392.1 predicted protein [Naegleria gruberi strain NEG-M]